MIGPTGQEGHCWGRDRDQRLRAGSLWGQRFLLVRVSGGPGAGERPGGPGARRRSRAAGSDVVPNNPSPRAVPRTGLLVTLVMAIDAAGSV